MSSHHASGQGWCPESPPHHQLPKVSRQRADHNTERICVSQGQEWEHARVRPARHHSSKEGIPFPSNCLWCSGLPDICVLGGRASVHLQTLHSSPKNIHLMHIVLEVGKILFSRPGGIKYYLITGRNSQQKTSFWRIPEVLLGLWDGFASVWGLCHAVCLLMWTQSSNQSCICLRSLGPVWLQRLRGAGWAETAILLKVRCNSYKFL